MSTPPVAAGSGSQISKDKQTRDIYTDKRLAFQNVNNKHLIIVMMKALYTVNLLTHLRSGKFFGPQLNFMSMQIQVLDKSWIQNIMTVSKFLRIYIYAKLFKIHLDSGNHLPPRWSISDKTAICDLKE